MAFNTRIALNMVDDTTEIDQAELLNGPLLHLTMMQLKSWMPWMLPTQQSLLSLAAMTR